jgi:oxygen-independent coproporphyrinogen III oxidase
MQQAKRAIQEAAQIGYKNLSLDLIYAVAGDTKALLEHDLNTAFSLPINHLSAYALSIEEGTVFQKSPQMSQERLDITKWLFDTISSHGFEQYEISNFGLYRSVHNIGYWEHKDYIGLGCGAVGCLKETRYYPSSSLEHYIKNPLEIHEEKLTPEEIKIEKIFLGLRSCVGIDKNILSPKEIQQCELLVQEHKLTCKHARYYNTEYLLSDELALFITA